MTKTPLIAFRCRPEALRKALEADAAKSGQSVTEIVLRALCKKYRIKYVPGKNGAPKQGEDEKP